MLWVYIKNRIASLKIYEFKELKAKKMEINLFLKLYRLHLRDFQPHNPQLHTRTYYT